MRTQCSLFLVLLASSLMGAEDQQEAIDPRIEALRAKIAPILKKYFPDSKISVEGRNLTASANVMTFQIHNVDKIGRISPEARPETGPTDSGFMLSIIALEEPYGGAADRPGSGSLRNRYWETYLGLIKMEDKDVCYNLDYGVNTNTEFIKEIHAVFEAIKKK